MTQVPLPVQVGTMHSISFLIVQMCVFFLRYVIFGRSNERLLSLLAFELNGIWFLLLFWELLAIRVY